MARELAIPLIALEVAGWRNFLGIYALWADKKGPPDCEGLMNGRGGTTWLISLLTTSKQRTLAVKVSQISYRHIISANKPRSQHNLAILPQFLFESVFRVK